jgi:hypothetical protein
MSRDIRAEGCHGTEQKREKRDTPDLNRDRRDLNRKRRSRGKDPYAKALKSLRSTHPPDRSLGESEAQSYVGLKLGGMVVAAVGLVAPAADSLGGGGG